jgi:hypothetical protein
MPFRRTTALPENVSYLVYAPFSLDRLHYDRDTGIVTYNPRPFQNSHLNLTATQRFSPLDALAALTAFIPEKGLQISRYYGHYNNKARGLRRRQNQPMGIPVAVSLSCSDEVTDDSFRRICRRAWARLIRKVYLADPLTCPKCEGSLQIISFIDNPSVIEKILKHLKLWDPQERPPPPRRSITVEPDADFLADEAARQLFDDID